MRSRARYVWWVLMCAVCACGTETERSRREPGRTFDAGGHGLPDRDGDGLCDFTEDDVGTDPNAADSDFDGLPDLIELVNGFDPTSRAAPDTDHVALLPAREHAAVDFPVRATVDGDGQDMTGMFEPLPAAYGDELSAADFFRGATAVSATPGDAVRDIDAASAHFSAVLGEARLAFAVRFEYPWAHLGDLECARSYPFRFSIKADDGRVRGHRQYLLLVAPDATSIADVNHCLPAICQ